MQNPGTIVRQICLFLGVPFDDRMLVPDGTEKTLLDTTGSHMNQAAMSVDKSKVAAWRNNVLPDKLRVSEMIAQDELRAWGYDLITTSTIPSLVLRTSELMLVSRQHRDLYDTILQAIANGSHSVRLENVGSLLDPVCGSMPDLWVTEEVPLPHPSSTSKVTSIVFIMRVVLLLLRLKFANAKLVWVFQPFPELSRKWWLRRMVEKVMVKMSTVTVLNCEKRISLAELKKYYGSGIDKCLRADDPNFTQMLLKRISLWSSSASDVAQQDAEQE
ncbi:hypothetical protein Tel_13610 [Candidatus Tenderia electrophaga]|uniref:Uncharacterized protein n=1 Tax=Candidatus Tenderia electrophaga TaxID=1748243 RepID=A0A0S2TG31_9GAMM|nr:hypothetical protein Tel_13610 [Candidatus Tenderia electrophaga]